MSGFNLLRRVGILATLLTFSVVWYGCGDDDNASGVEGPGLEELIDIGWEEFEDADYIAALQSFEGAIGIDQTHEDAWNGAGWSSGRIPGRLNQAIDYFTTAFYSLDTTRYDALGGLAFAKYQAGEWHSAVNKADSLLARRPGWRFLHEATLDFNDAWLLIAKCRYNLGEYQSSLEVIQTHFNDTFDVDIRTEQGIAELLFEIERLGQVYG